MPHPRCARTLRALTSCRPFLLLFALVAACQSRNRHRAFREALEGRPDAGAPVVLDLRDCEITSDPAALHNLERVRSLRGHRGSVDALALSDTGEFLATGGPDGVIRVWDARSGELRSHMETRGEVRSLAFRPETTLLASAGASSGIELWDASSGERRGVLRSRDSGTVTAVAFNRESSLMASGSSAGSVHLWNPRTSTEVYAFRNVGSGEVRSLAFDPDGTSLAVVCADGGVRLIDTRSTRRPRSLRSAAREAVFSPSGAALAIVPASSGSPLEIWDPHSGRRLRSLAKLASPVQGAAFNRAGDLLATVQADGTLSLWDLRDGRTRKTLPVRPGSSRVAFSRDGLLLAAVSESIDLYETRPWTWKQRWRPPANTSPRASSASIEVKVIGSGDGGAVSAGYPFVLELVVSVDGRAGDPRRDSGVAPAKVVALDGLEARIRIDGFASEKLVWIGTVRSDEPARRRVTWTAPFDPGLTTASGTVELRALAAGASGDRTAPERTSELIARRDFQFFLEGIPRPELVLSHRVVERRPLAFAERSTGAGRVIQGELLRLGLTLGNRGSVRADGLRGRLVPVHPRERIVFLDAAELDFGDLAPGESATREVSVRLEQPGLAAIQFRFGARGRSERTSVDELVVIQPGATDETRIARPTPSPEAPGREARPAGDPAVPGNTPPAIVVLRPTRQNFHTTEPEITFVIAITDDTGVRSVEFTRNGVAVARGNTRGVAGISRPSPASAGPSDRIHLEQTIELVVGRNEIEIVATDIDGQSTRERRTILRRANPGEYYVLCVGIREYPDSSIPDLPVSERDAAAIYRFFSTHPKSPARRENVQLVVGKDATAKGIKKSLETYLARRARPRDTVIFYYSGHGFAHGGKYYLVPRDGELDALGSTAIDMRELQKLWDLVAAERKVFIADACNSGGFTVLRDLGESEPRRGFSGLLGPSQPLADWDVPGGTARGSAVLTASSSNERAIEDLRLGHGIYTFHLLEALEGRADADRDGRVNLTEVHAYLQATVPVSARGLGHKQTPNAKLDVSGEIFLTR